MKEQKKNPSKEVPKPGSKRRRTLERLLLLLALALLIRRWVWMPTFILGDSMLPTLHSGEIAGVNKLIYLLRPPHRGEVVAVWSGKELMIKRVLGLPGEYVEMRGGVLYIDGRPLAEPYVRFSDYYDIAPGRMGPGRFVLAGDNRPETLIEIANRERIVGRLRPRRRVRYLSARSLSLMRAGQTATEKGIACVSAVSLPLRKPPRVPEAVPTSPCRALPCPP